MRNSKQKKLVFRKERATDSPKAMRAMRDKTNSVFQGQRKQSLFFDDRK